MKLLGTIFDYTLNALAFIAGLLLAFLMLSIAVEVILRFITGHSVLWWAVETSEYILLYFTFLAAAWLLKRGGHIKMDIIFVRLKPRVQGVMNVINSILIALVSLILIWYGGETVLEHFKLGLYAPFGLEIPKYILLLIIPIGFLFLFIQSLRMLYVHVLACKGITKQE